MKTITPSLITNPQLPVITTNFESMKKWVLSRVEPFKDVVVTEDKIIQAKADRADLNKVIKALNDAKKETVKIASEPIIVFERQIKDLCTIIDDVNKKIDVQIKNFEEKEREEKQVKTCNIIKKCFEKYKDSCKPFLIEIKANWLNKTTSLASIERDINAIIESHIQKEKQERELRQAEQDRLSAIESKVKGLNLLHDTDFQLALFLSRKNTSLETPLGEVNSLIEREFTSKIEAIKRQETKNESVVTPQAKTIVEQKVTTPSHVVSSIQTVTQEKIVKSNTVHIVFSFTDEKANEVKSLLKEIRSITTGFNLKIEN